MLVWLHLIGHSLTARFFPSWWEICFGNTATAWLPQPLACLRSIFGKRKNDVGTDGALTINTGIPHHGSVWFVQVLSTDDALTINTGIPHHGSVWFVQVLSTKTAMTINTGIPHHGSVW